MITSKLMNSRGESGEQIIWMYYHGHPVKVELANRCEIGGGSRASTPPPTPPVPSRDAAAENVSRDSGNRKRKGYQSTILGGRKDAQAELAQAAQKTLLGQ